MPTLDGREGSEGTPPCLKKIPRSRVKVLSTSACFQSPNPTQSATGALRKTEIVHKNPDTEDEQGFLLVCRMILPVSLLLRYQVCQRGWAPSRTKQLVQGGEPPEPSADKL